MEDENADRVYVPGTNPTPPARDVEPFWPPEELEPPVHGGRPVPHDAPPARPVNPAGVPAPRSESDVYRPSDRPVPPPPVTPPPMPGPPPQPLPQGEPPSQAWPNIPPRTAASEPAAAAPVSGASDPDSVSGVPADSPWAQPPQRPSTPPPDVDIQPLGRRGRVAPPPPEAVEPVKSERADYYPTITPRQSAENGDGPSTGTVYRPEPRRPDGSPAPQQTGPQPPGSPQAGPPPAARQPGPPPQPGPQQRGPQPGGLQPGGPQQARPQQGGPPQAGPQQAGNHAARQPAPPQSGPPQSGPPQSGPSRAGHPQSGPPHTNHPQSAPPHAGPPHTGHPQSAPPHAAPPHAGPQHAGPPAQPQQQPPPGPFPPAVDPRALQAHPPGAQQPPQSPAPGAQAPPVDPYQQLPWVSDGTPTAEEFARRRLAKPAEPTATMGARAMLQKTTMGLVRLAPGKYEKEYKQDVEMVRRNFGGLRQVTVVNPKGGAGKTVAVLLLAMTFGQKRGGYVLAWDNNETQGTLGMRAQQDFHARTVRDMMRDLHLFRGSHGRVGDLSQYVRAQGEGMFDVLASDESATAGEMLTASAFAEIREIVSRFYKLIFVDTGNNVRAQNWQAAMDATDQLVITMSARNDSAETAARMLDHLEQSGRQRLVRQAVSVVTMPPTRKDIDLPAIQRHFAARTRAVLMAPYEKLIDSGEPLRYGQLSGNTRDAWLKIAASVAEGL